MRIKVNLSIIKTNNTPLAILSAVVQSRCLVLSDFIGRVELCERAFAYEMVIATKHKKVNSGWGYLREVV